MDGAEIFGYGAMIVLQIGRSPAAGPSANGNGSPLTGVTAWTGGQKWFVGWRVQNVRIGSVQMEAFQYKFAGPWDFFFERLVFQKLWLTWNGTKQIADWRSQVILGQSVTSLTGAGDTVTGSTTTNLMSIAQQLIEIAQYCAAQSSFEQTVNGLGWPAGPQFQTDNLTTDVNGNYQLKTPARGSIGIPDFVPGFTGSNNDITSATAGLVLRAPLDAVNDMTCAECFRRMLRWIGAMGSAVSWFDYTTTPPTLKVSTRDQLPNCELRLADCGLESIKIQRRDDLIPSAIAFKYRISGQINGTPYSVVENDIAAVVDGEAVEGVGQFGNLFSPGGRAISSDSQTQLPLQARRFSSQIATFDFEGITYQQAAGAIVTAALNLADPSSGGSALTFWLSLFPELAGANSLGFYHDSSGAIGPAVTDATGAAINTTIFSNILMDGNVCPWMYVNNNPNSNTPGQTVEATINAWFKYDDNAAMSGDATVNPGSAACHQKTIKLKLTNLTTGTYQSRPNFNAGEPVPYGLPGYIFAIESIPQYQGTFAVVEREISDVCPMGNCLNLSGGMAEWATMNACVQSIIYTDAGRTELTFGPAQHLGNADLVERLRVNRGPRWYNLIGNDLLNGTPRSGALEMGKAVPLRGPSAGNKIPTFQIIPSSLPGIQGATTALPLPPGVSLWGKNALSSGVWSAVDAGPGIALADGTLSSNKYTAFSGQYILISLTQLAAVVGAQVVKFRELNTCEDGDNTYYRTFLCTDKYHH